MLSETYIHIPNPFMDLDELREAKYDAKVTKILMRRYRISAYQKRLMLEGAGNRCKRRIITLSLFKEFFPNFPMELLAFCRRPSRPQNSVADLFANFGNTDFVKHYELYWQELRPRNPTEPFGLVIDWKYTQSGGGLVLHNHPIDTRVLGSRLLWVGKHGQLVLEPLKVLLDTIDSEAPGGKGWQPEFVNAVDASPQGTHVPPDVDVKFGNCWADCK